MGTVGTMTSEGQDLVVLAPKEWDFHYEEKPQTLRVLRQLYRIEQNEKLAYRKNRLYSMLRQ